MSDYLPNIKHFVYLMLENRSFDNLMGWLYEDGAPAQIIDGPATSVPQGGAVTTREGALDRAVSTTPSVVRRAPGGDTTGTLLPNAPVRVLARSGDWVRVQMEGWVRGTDLRPASEGVLVGVSGAEVRASPEQYEGRTLQWTLQLLSVETSDGVRRELPVGRRYMLARGPLPEVGFVYVLLQDDQVAEMQRLSPLSEVVTLVLVRVGGDRFLGNPVVELIDMSVREP